MKHPRWIYGACALVLMLLLVVFFLPSKDTFSDYEYNAQWGTAGNGNGQFNTPTDIATDSLGNFYVADSGNSRVQKFDSNGNYLLQWGTAGNGVGQFNMGDGQITVDKFNDVYVVDQGNDRVQKFDSSGNFILSFGSTGNGNGQFSSPYGIIDDGGANIYVTDGNNHRVQMFDSTGVYQSEWGTFGTGNGQFSTPRGITIDNIGNFLVVDSGNNRIEKFDFMGVYVSQFGTAGTGDGEFSEITDLWVDASDNIYVFDIGNDRIQGFDSSYTFLEDFGTTGTGNGQFNYAGQAAGGLVIDYFTSIMHVVDYNNNRVQKFILDVTPPTGVLSTGALSVTTPFTVTLTPSETIEGLTLADFTVTNGFASALSGTGPYTLTITPAAAGAVTVQVAAGKFTDTSGNLNTVTNLLSVTYSGVMVTQNFCPTSKWLTGDSTHEYFVTLADVQSADGVFSASDPVYVGGGVPNTEIGALGFDFSSIPATASIVGVTLNGEWKANEAFVVGDREIIYAHFGTYNTNVAFASLHPVGSTDLVNIHNPTDVITVGEIESASATLATIPTLSQLQTMYLVAFNDGHLGFDYACAQVSYVIPPTATLSTGALTVTAPFTVTLTPSESITGLTLGDFTVTNGTASNLVGAGVGPYTVTITPTASGVVTINVPIGSFDNAYPISNTAATNMLSVTYDAPPTAVLSTPSLNVSNAFTVTLTPSESITGLTLGDFTVTNGTVSNLAGAGVGPYTVLITPTTEGTVTVTVPIGSFSDSFPTANTTATNTLSVDYDKPGGGGSGGGIVCPYGTTGIYPNCVVVVNPPNPVDPPPVDPPPAPVTPKTYVSPIDGYTKSCNAFTSYMRVYSPLNNTYQVRLWQAFLNERMDERLPLTGYFGSLTFNAIKRFQSKYFSEILAPWGINAPTGYIYKSTRAQANKILGCSEGTVILDNGAVINN